MRHPPMQLAKRVWDFSTSYDLLRPGDRVVIAVSGGPDSLCLVDMLSRLAARHHLELHVAYLNHGLRSEAATEVAFVQAQAEARSLRFWTETVDTRAVARRQKLSLETAARQLRYNFLWRTAREAGAGRVAVAHTADDQAETVLMHVLRGTGLRGLRGMLPKRVVGESAIGNWAGSGLHGQLPITNYQLPIYLIRPLLRVTRSEVMEYCAQHKLTPLLDTSNRDPSFTRNRVRHELLPMLAAYNPNIRLTMARMAEAAAGDYEIWLEGVREVRHSTACPDGGDGESGGTAFERQRWLALSVSQQRSLLRAAVERLSGELADVDFAPIDTAAEFSRRAAPGRSCEVVPGLALKVETECIRLVLGAPPEPADWPWLAGTGLAAGWQLAAEPEEPLAWSRRSSAVASRWAVHVDADRLAGPLVLRSRRPGDRFQPLGMKGQTVKLSDFMINQKIPVTQRSRWPLLSCGDEIVWVVGLRLDERYRVTNQTRSIMQLSIRRVGAE